MADQGGPRGNRRVGAGGNAPGGRGGRGGRGRGRGGGRGGGRGEGRGGGGGGGVRQREDDDRPRDDQRRGGGEREGGGGEVRGGGGHGGRERERGRGEGGGVPDAAGGRVPGDRRDPRPQFDRARHVEPMEFEEADNDDVAMAEPQQHIRRLGYNRLQEMLNTEPDELVNLITLERSGFPRALDDRQMMKRQDTMALMLGVIKVALTSTANPNAVILLLNKIRSSAFLTQGLQDYLTGMQLVNAAARLRGFRQPIKDSLSLLKALMNSFPGHITNLIPTIAMVEYVIRALRQNTVVIDDEIDVSLEELCATREDLLEREKNKKAAEEETRGNLEGGGQPLEQREPPNNFREMTIFPDVYLDIMSRVKPFLRPNITTGGYEDVAHYLDVHFRLLREDFIQPLRQGIREYLDLKKDTGKRIRLADIRVYHDVSVLTPVCTHSGIQYRLRFDVSRMKHVNWRYSKRLIFGSLLCLSKDEFNTIYIATVADRKAEMLQDGYLQVKFEVDPEAVRRIQPDERFLMVETSAYFEAYRHVLRGLQAMEEIDIPFRENIVKCAPEVNRPRYLLTPAEPTYNIQPLVDGNRPRPGLHRRRVDSDDSDDDFEVAPFTALPVLQLNRWPSADTLHLDESQLRALKAALTRELTIIQGPPGTGKTHIGLKIVEALYLNRRIWNPGDNRGDNSPILVVCYTNHALDQFLEGISGFMRTGIVRVGGRSKNEKLKGFLLAEQRRKVRDNRTVPRAIFQARMESRQEMEKWQIEIEKTAALIEGSERGLLHEQVLEDFMSDDHYLQLTERVHPEQTEQGIFSNKSSSFGASCLPMWLGLGELLYVEEEPAAPDDANAAEAEDPAAAAAAAPNAPADVPAPGERIEIEDEVAAMENERRILELEDDELALRRHQEEARRMRNVDRANQRLAVDFDNLPEAEGEWRVQRINKKKRRQRLQQGLRSTDAMSEEEARNVRQIWVLDIATRWRLYRYWTSQYKRDLRENVLECEQNFQIAADRLKEILEEEDRAILQTMTVIGMTTTGAARYKNALRQIRPRIVIVEEAAEVLEAHVITTLSSGCEHLVLIGDHLQLRPSANVYKLAEEYGLKYSLFERLVKNEVPYETLENQHRMRPEIADLVRLIYPNLRDHESVVLYENIKGIEQNLFLINHDEEEYKDEELKSVSNEHEATFMVALCRYLTLQGYHNSQITILTPYTGQMFLFRRLMPKEQFDGVRVCPIDNYQGEENDIVLLSLVRSNADGKIGFVKDDNRACVAMSRAKKGLYVIGNFDHLAKHSNLWSRITQKARMAHQFGETLTLCCQNHPAEARIAARRAKDFDQAPEGGCLRPCGFRLQCGHACERVCHSYDRDHASYRCMKPCGKVLCGNNHLCRKRCQEPCGDCKQPVPRTMPNCGHVQPVPCSVPVYDFKCQGDCNHTLECGHMCRNKCGEDHTKKCFTAVNKTLRCGHTIRINCYQRSNESIPCPEKCTKRLDCQHECPGQCGSCMQGRLHVPCKSDCGRTLVCGHQCTEPCTKNCPPCGRPCENRCFHSRCQRECGRPCVRCIEPCQWRCDHYRCTKHCHEPCDRPRCDRPCRKRLGCGHLCIGLCGESCPDKCRVCHEDVVNEIFFGTEDETDARFVQLEDCGHIFEVSGLDQWMDMVVDRRSAVDIQLKQCPRCKTTIRRNLRYGTIINAVLEDIERVKAKILGDMARNDAKKREIMGNLGELHLSKDEAKYYKERLDGPALATDELTCIENVVNFLAHIINWKAKVDKIVVGLPHAPAMKFRRLKEDMAPLEAWLLQKRVRLGEQELREASLELTRFDLLAKFTEIDAKIDNCRSADLTEEKRRQFREMFRRLESGQPMTDNMEKEARRVAEAVQKCMGSLGISNQERIQIVQAMGMGQGHWFKCPNGHIYAIGDCGGAMEEGRCPECGAQVGGRNHALRQDNRLAGEMDGATAPAFNPNQLMNEAQLRQFMFD